MSSSDSQEDKKSVDKLDLIIKEIKNLKLYNKKKFKEIEEGNSKIYNNVVELNKELAILKKENLNLKETVLKQKADINLLERQILENTVSIHGIPESKDENITNIVYNISSIADVKLTTSSVVKAFRKKGNLNGKPGQIIVKFSTSVVHDLLIEKVKRKGLKLADIGVKGNNEQIYVNHEMTQLEKSIFFEARKIQKNKNWKYVWEKNGLIYVKKEEGSQAIRINSIEQLNTI